MAISGHKTESMFQRYNNTNTDDVRHALTAVQEHNRRQVEKVAVIAAK